jgi:hypothetical protein
LLDQRGAVFRPGQRPVVAAPAIFWCELLSSVNPDLGTLKWEFSEHQWQQAAKPLLVS